MQANELRIGNYVNGTISGFNLKELHIVDFSVIAFLSGQLNTDKVSLRFEPIELTEEWLLKFGFINNGQNIFDSKDCIFSIRINGNGIICTIGINFPKIDINYVHQLQNLYFALTQNELTIKT